MLYSSALLDVNPTEPLENSMLTCLVKILELSAGNNNVTVVVLKNLFKI
jgi:hypothetical protein